jgi:hypothetical protein
MYKVLVGKPEGKRLLERPRCRWEDGIRVDLREIGCGSVEWIHLAQHRDWWWALVNTVMNLRVLAPHSYRNGNAHHIGMGSLVHSGIIAVKREEFVSDRCHVQ